MCSHIFSTIASPVALSGSMIYPEQTVLMYGMPGEMFWYMTVLMIIPRCPLDTPPRVTGTVFPLHFSWQ